MVDALAGYTKLMLLIEEDNIDGVSQLLEKGTDLNVQNKSGQTALAIAAKNGAKAIVHKLLAHGAEINLKNKFGQTALFTACSQNFEDIVKLLIEFNADINIKDTRGWTPLMIACYHSHTNIVKILLHYGADIIAEDSFGKTAINRTKSPEIYQMLTYYAHKELEKYQGTEPTQGDWSQKSLQAQNETRISSQTPSSQSQKGQPRSYKESVDSQYDLLSTQKSPTAAGVGKKQKGSRLSYDQGSAKLSGRTQNLDAAASRQKAAQKEQSVRQSKRESPQHVRLESPSQTEGDTKGSHSRYKSPESFVTSPSKRVSTQPQSKVTRLQSPPPQYPSKATKQQQDLKPSSAEVSSRHSRSNNSTVEQVVANEQKQTNNQARSFLKKVHPVLKALQPKKSPKQLQKTHYVLNNEETVTISQVKKMLSHYIGDYSELVQTCTRQKLSYALGFEVRRCFASAKQELMAVMLENAINLHKEFIESFAVLAGNTSTALLGSRLAKCNDDVAALFQDFESKLLATAEDHESIQTLHQNSNELDELLVRDVDERYTQKEEESRDEFEKDIFKFLKLEMNLQVGKIYGSVNEVLDVEFKQSDAQFKLLVQEIVSTLLGQVSLVWRNSFGQEIIQEEDEAEEQSNRKQRNLSSHDLQEQVEGDDEIYQEQHQYEEIHHVGYVFIDPNPLQPLDMNKELHTELDNLPHTKSVKSSNHKADYGTRVYQDTTSFQTENEVVKGTCNVGGECIEIVSSEPKQKASEAAQLTPLREGQNSKNYSREEKENIDLKEDNVIQNIEHISRALDKALSRRSCSSLIRTELEPKKMNRSQNYYLSPGLTKSHSKLSFRELERSSLFKSEEKPQNASMTELQRSAVEQHIPQLSEAAGNRYIRINSEEYSLNIGRRELRQQKRSPKYSIGYAGQKELSEHVNGLTSFEIERTEDSIANHFESLERSKENVENSCELTAREKSLDTLFEEETLFKPTEEVQNQQIYIQEAQNMQEHKQMLNSEDDERPEQLTVKEIQQKAEEKVEFFANVISPGKEAKSANDIPKSSSDNFNTIEEPKIIPINHRSIFEEHCKRELRHTLSEEVDLSFNYAQSFVVGNKIFLDFLKNVDNIDSTRRLNSEFSDVGNLSCRSDADLNRSALTQSLIFEGRDLRAAVHSAIRRSNRIQLEYLDSKQNRSKQSRIGAL